MAKLMVGVMGPGEDATDANIQTAEYLGRLIAKEGLVVLTGGRNVGVMDAASKGAKSAGGLTIGILPGSDLSDVSEYVDIPIVTGIGNARNNINVLSSDIIVSIGLGLGTISEIALALKSGKRVLTLDIGTEAWYVLNFLAPEKYRLLSCQHPEHAIQIIKHQFKI